MRTRTKTKAAPLVITLDMRTPLTGRLDIWVDVASNRFCLGPPRGPRSAAVPMRHVGPHEFFAWRS